MRRRATASLRKSSALLVTMIRSAAIARARIFAPETPRSPSSWTCTASKPCAVRRWRASSGDRFSSIKKCYATTCRPGVPAAGLPWHRGRPLPPHRNRDRDNLTTPNGRPTMSRQRELSAVRTGWNCPRSCERGAALIRPGYASWQGNREETSACAPTGSVRSFVTRARP